MLSNFSVKRSCKISLLLVILTYLAKLSPSRFLAQASVVFFGYRSRIYLAINKEQPKKHQLTIRHKKNGKSQLKYNDCFNPNLKLVSAIFYQFCYFSAYDSPSKTMKMFFTLSKQIFIFPFFSTLSKSKRTKGSGIINAIHCLVQICR